MPKLEFVFEATREIMGGGGRFSDCLPPGMIVSYNGLVVLGLRCFFLKKKI